ncbi:unnamed protein product, partial [marine sediment metagenome]
TPLDTVSINAFEDTLNSSGVYYYSIIASNDYGNSDLSNVQSVEIIEMETGGLFTDFNWGEIIVIVGIVGAIQIILTVTMVVLLKSGSKPTKKRK